MGKQKLFINQREKKVAFSEEKIQVLKEKVIKNYYSQKEAQEIIKNFRMKVLKEDLAKFIVQFDLDPLKRSFSSLKLVTMPKLWTILIGSFDAYPDNHILLTEMTNIMKKTIVQKEKKKEDKKLWEEKQKVYREKEKVMRNQIKKELSRRNQW